MSIFGKVRVLVLAHSNDLLDKAIDMNSIPVLKQYIRNLEEARDKSRHESNVAVGAVQLKTSEIAGLTSSISSDTTRGKAFMSLTPPDTNSAQIVAGRIHDNQAALADAQSELEVASADSDKLKAALAQIEAKHSEMMHQLNHLQSTDRMADSMHHSSDAIRQANDATHGMNVDDLTKRIESKSATARAEFDQTIVDTAPAPDPIKDAAVADIMASFK